MRKDNVSVKRSEGNTREDVLKHIRMAISKFLSQTEIATVDVAGNGANPWLATAGLFAGDPDLLPILQEVYAARDAECPA